MEESKLIKEKMDNAKRHENRALYFESKGNFSSALDEYIKAIEKYKFLCETFRESKLKDQWLDKASKLLDRAKRVRGLKGDIQDNEDKYDPLKILKIRLALGEISIKEFNKLKEAMFGRNPFSAIYFT